MSPTDLDPLMQRNFLEYASYVVVDRAIPDLRDGCKPVQRRILQTLWEVEDGKFHKVANVVGETMKLHPHGDASIFEALVVLANKEYFIERQGNFGNLITGHDAAAARYIECRLTPLAKEALFNPSLTIWKPSYDGRKDEAVFLPAKLPVVLLLGTEGIAVGMATSIMPHNFRELLEAQIKLLRGEEIHLVPDFPQGGLMDASEYADGKGRVRVRARIEADGDKRVVIREVPFGTTTESLIASIEAAAQKGKVKIGGISDFTTDRVEIEILLPRGIYAAEVIPQLYAYTACEQSINSSLIIIRDGHPIEPTVTEVLRALTNQLRDLIKAELEWELCQLTDQRHWLTLEQIFIENRVYKKIEEQKTADGVRQAVWNGMMPFKAQFVRDMVDADVDKLLEIRIRRISAFDIARHRQQITEIDTAIATAQSKLKRLTATTIAWIEAILRKYGQAWPRRTEVTTFTAIDKKAVARADRKVAYDPESGFFGHEVRGDAFVLQVSEYDKILLITQDGVYRIVQDPAKVLLTEKLVHAAVFDEEAGAAFIVVYRDDQRHAFAKRIRIQGHIRDKEYELIKERAGRLDLLLPIEAKGTLHCEFVKAKQQRITESDFDLAAVDYTGIAARGTRVAPKPVARLKYLPQTGG